MYGKVIVTTLFLNVGLAMSQTTNLSEMVVEASRTVSPGTRVLLADEITGRSPTDGGVTG